MKNFETYNNSRTIYSLEILSTAKNKEALIINQTANRWYSHLRNWHTMLNMQNLAFVLERHEPSSCFK